MSRVLYHLTTEHVYYLANYQCYLTLKADGYYKKDESFEYELVDNKKYIFNVLDSKDDIQNKIFNLADSLDIKFPSILREEVNISNIEYILKTFLDFYDNYEANLIPKFYLKIKKNDFISILSYINNFFPNNGFPNDGWVIVPENEKYIAKLKPSHHLTIDLKFKNNKFYANNWIDVNAVSTRRLKNNSVYRCYWENNKWFAKEERTDKRYGNNIDIIEVITNYLSKGYNFSELDKSNFSNYYDHNLIEDYKIINYLNFMKEFSQNWIKDNVNISNKVELLDIGCGKRSSLEMLKDIGIKNIVGIDADPICILKSIINSRKNSYIWLDFNYNWNVRDQIKKFGNVWADSQLFKMYHLYKKFDVILFNFSIFYCFSENYEMLIYNLNKVSKVGTKLLFNFMNYDEASDKLREEFKITKEEDNININLPWLNRIHKEPNFNNNKFTEILLKNKWKLENKCKINNVHENFIDWQNIINYQVWVKI